jgi:5-methyltetrahydrofolate corrinoid/iron sulfur protein methyltransferase
LAKGLAACRRPPILNAVTCQPDKIEALPDMAARSGADLTALLLDPSGFPPQSHEEKLTLAQEIHQSAANHGLGLDRLIFDPVVPPMNWPDATLRAGEAIQTIRLLASGLFFQEPAATMIGLSNLLSGQRKTYPSTYDAALLAMAVGAGLSHALVNVLDPATRNTLKLIQQLGPKNGSTG